MTTNEPSNNAAAEVAAAEAELKAAQEKLEAAKAKLASQGGEDDSVEEVTVATVIVDEATDEVEAVVVEDVAVAVDASAENGDTNDQVEAGKDESSDAPAASSDAADARDGTTGEDTTDAAEPGQAPACEARPVQTDEPEAEPDWVPYSTAPTPPAYEPPAQQPTYGQPAAAPVPPAGATGSVAPNQQPPAGYAPGYGAPQTPHAGPGAVPPQQPYYGYQQPYYQQPYQQPAVTTKDHVAAGLLAIFLGTLGIHKFYLGYNTAGFIMLAVTILGSLFTFGLAGAVIWVIAIIEGILYLTKSQAEFEQIYVLNKREWF